MTDVIDMTGKYPLGMKACLAFMIEETKELEMAINLTQESTHAVAPIIYDVLRYFSNYFT